RRRATINVFMLDDDPRLVAFVDLIARLNGGRVFAPAPDRLGDYVVSDYLRARRGGWGGGPRRLRRGGGAGGGRAAAGPPPRGGPAPAPARVANDVEAYDRPAAGLVVVQRPDHARAQDPGVG